MVHGWEAAEELVRLFACLLLVVFLFFSFPFLCVFFFPTFETGFFYVTPVVQELAILYRPALTSNSQGQEC